MKIGILTFYSPDNYGAALQAYCLAHYIQSKGHEVKFIKHELSKHGTSQANCSMLSWLKNMAVSMMVYPTRQKRLHNFRTFAKMHFEIEEYNDTFDKIVIGSDQVWNLSLTKNDLYYLGLDFKCATYSYAASCGDIKSFSEQQIRLLKKGLHSQTKIAVREKETQLLLEKLLQRPIVLTLDPTLLVDNEVLANIEENGIKGKYILIYDCMNNEIYDFACILAKQIQVKIVALSCCVRLRTMCKSFQSASIGKFLKLFSEAECIVTTSFHGCAISLSYNKDFYAINFNKHTTSRMRELLQSVGLIERFVSPNEHYLKFSKINYAQVNKALAAMRMSSREYLDNVLNDYK